MKKVDTRIYSIKNEDLVLEEVSKLRPLKYNKFQWWRRFASPNKPLEDKAVLIDKIKNGDLEFSNYYWQALYTELELNAKREEVKDGREWIEATQVGRARRKRLWEDFEKDEAKKLEYLKRQFVKTFKMSVEDYEEQLLKIDGTLEDLYYRCENLFGFKIKELRSPGVKRQPRVVKYRRP
tara:strand:+ start:124 stop:663 length:540 start_codon:yes stop_codon:yes gene_type:complete